MKMPPQRIALVALVAVVLVGALAWWQARTAEPRAQATRATSALDATTPAVPSAGKRAPQVPVAAAMAAREQCKSALFGGVIERTRQLAGRDDAASQLAYALTADMTGPSPKSEQEISRLMAVKQRAFARARQLDPAHTDIAWLAAENCLNGPECAAAQEAALQAEPDNAAVWLRAMTRAHARNDDAALEQAFKRAAAAPRYDSHRGSTVVAVMDGYAGLPMPAACMDTDVQALVREEMPGGGPFHASMFIEKMALGREFMSMTYANALRTLCEAADGGALPSGRQADCVRIYSAIASGPSMVEQQMALSKLVELTADAPEGAAHRERYRQLQWLTQEKRKHSKLLDHVAMGASEVETFQTALAKAGRWPPPADWLPAGERARSLILTGRPPAETKRK